MFMPCREKQSILVHCCFELRITAEELVSTQTDLLRTVGELDVENREIARLSKATESGAISQKTLLERNTRRRNWKF